MNREYGVYLAILAVIFILGGGIWWTNKHQTPATPTETVATSSPSTDATSSTRGGSVQPVVPKSSTPSPAPAVKPTFSLVPGDEPVSWYFVGTYNDGGQLEARATSEIQRMKGLLNSGTFTNYELYVSIANQYELLGDGKQEYIYLNYALAIDSTKTGLAWHNMGKLLERVGSYKSARVAYDAMIAAQTTSQYIRARLEFLKAYMPEDTDAITQAEIDLVASKEY